MASSSGHPIDMLVLDAIQDDIEQLPSIMRMLGEWRPRIDEEYVENDVLDALRRLLDEGLVVAYEESLVEAGARALRSIPVSSRLISRLTGSTPTPSGRARWESWQRTFDQ